MSTQPELSFQPQASVCPTCGRKVVEYKFGLNKGLVAFLWKLARAGRPVTLDELNLTPGQYTNHALVRHWGLAEMLPPENEIEQRKGGKWQLTLAGEHFLAGNTEIEKYVFTIQNKITRRSGPFVNVRDIDEGYLYRQDYRDQAARQIG